MIVPFKEHTPKLGANVFVAPDAWVIGDVEIGDDVAVLFGAVIRGDLMPIRIGNRTNIQDHVMIHTSWDHSTVTIGDDVTIGHRAVLHGCSVGNRSLIGMGAIVLDNSVVPEDCLVGAGALVTEEKIFPPRSLIIGSPARAVRQLTEGEIASLTDGAHRYMRIKDVYRDLFGKETV